MKDFDSIYFVGAGGIGMAALERYFLSKGKKVAGYDRTPTDLTRALEAEGVEIAFDENPDLIPSYCRDKERTLVVYTPAVPDSHAGLRWFRSEGFEVVKRAKVLGVVTEHSKGLCFAGTHGKTTTSSMAAHILEVSGIGCNAFLGGVLRNYGSNFLLSDSSPYSVIEADEFDRSFHQLSPYIAVITSTDADHLDIYGNYENYLESFAHFTELVRPGGALIVHTGLALKPRPQEGVATYSYSLNEGDFHATNVRKGNGEIVFDFVTPTETITDVNLGVPVDINIENAVAAMAACWLVKVPSEAMKKAIGTFIPPVEPIYCRYHLDRCRPPRHLRQLRKLPRKFRPFHRTRAPRWSLDCAHWFGTEATPTGRRSHLLLFAQRRRLPCHQREKRQW